MPPPNKGYGNSTTIAFDVTDREHAHLVLLSLAETLAARLRSDHVRAGVLSVGIKDWDFHYYSHQAILSAPTNITEEIFQTACRVFDEAWDELAGPPPWNPYQSYNGGKGKTAGAV